MFDGLYTKYKLLYKFGIYNVLSVIVYRLKCKSKIFKNIYPGYSISVIPQYHSCSDCGYIKSLDKRDESFIISIADKICEDQYNYYFGNNYYKFIDWHTDSISKQSLTTCKDKHWSEIGHFDSKNIDIKNIWELSRFYWFPQLILAFRITKDNKYIDKAFQNLNNWILNNKSYLGANWICGQEVGYRLINFILGLHLLDCKELAQSDAVKCFIEGHINRIEQTMYYANAQKNNHIVTECTAIITGCMFLDDSKNTRRHLNKAYKTLKYNLTELVFEDGGFAQYSTNYHRLVLDTLSLLLLFHDNPYIKSEDKKFIKQKHHKLTCWLRSIVDPKSGKSPNIGCNDGSLLFKLDGTCYDNYSFSLYLAEHVNQSSSFIDILAKFQINEGNKQNTSIDNSNSGFLIINYDSCHAVLKYPSYKFRPPQSDILHFDLFINGQSILIDSGTYSYNSKEAPNALKSAKNHNTVVFDNGDQMPKIGRFMYGEWPELFHKSIDTVNNNYELSYKDYKGNEHGRSFSIDRNHIFIKDKLKMTGQSAKLYWHLGESDISVIGNTVETDAFRLTICTDDVPSVIEVCDALSSSYYQELKKHKCIIVNIANTNRMHIVTTEMEIKT